KRMEGATLRRLPEAVLRWVDQEENDPALRLKPGYDLILATAQIDRGVVVKVTSKGRRSAVPQKMPYVYSARSKGNEPLKSLKFFENDKTRMGIAIEIDTSNAGFQSSPNYLIQLEKNTDPPVPENLPDQNAIEKSCLKNVVKLFENMKQPLLF